MKRTTKWAVGITVLWLVGVAVLVYLKRATFGELGLNEWGDFLAGTVASPLALIWLVAAYRQQGEDLQLNTEALHLQQQELKEQVKATLQVATHAEQQAEVSRAMYEFNYEETQRSNEERRAARLREIKPDIYLVVRQRSGLSWELGAKNSGGDAFRFEVQTSHFERVHCDFKRFERGEIKPIQLHSQKSSNDSAFLTIRCWDQDENQYMFHYRFDEELNSIVSLHPYENGVLVKR